MHDDEHMHPSAVRPVFDDIAHRMAELMPHMCARLKRAMVECRVRERCRTSVGPAVCSEDLLVCNVGASAAYQSPEHLDAADVGWTTAMAVKCEH